MEISIQKSNQLKSIAILMMMCLHLFNTLDFNGLFEPLLYIGEKPVIYYISLFCDACVPIFAFVSGYGLFYKFKKNRTSYSHENRMRIQKLFLNYWIILFLFVVVLGFLLSKEGYPGSIFKFFLNFTAISVSYNGAWWFLTTYLLFVITSSFWFQLLLQSNSFFYLILLIILYVAGFYFRIYEANIFYTPILEWFQTQLALYFCTLFQFMLGAFTLHFRLNSKVSALLKRVPSKKYFLVLGIVLLIAIHGVLPNFFFAPFIGLVFILIYCQLSLYSFLQKGINFFTPHATNIWLIHMFFYMIYFKEIIYAPKNPFLIFWWLVCWCLVASYLVNSIYRPVIKRIDAITRLVL